MAKARSRMASYLLPLRRLLAALVTCLAASHAVAAPPTITEFTLTPSTITSLPATQTYTVRTSGSTVSRVMIDFGDGYRLLVAAGSGTLWTGTRPVTVTGQHAATANVMNSAGELSQRKAVWSATSSGRPTLTVNGGDPATVQTVTTSSYSMSGTASGTGISLLVTSDRSQRMVPAGTTSWSGNLTLKPGLNRIIAQVRESDGDTTTADRLVRYEPAGSLSISNISAGAATERWSPLEITFDINNSAATNPYVPYEPTAPGVLSQFDGITVNGVFWLASNPSVTYTRPAFLYQGYLYDTSKSTGYDWYMPTGSPTWMLRFSPPALGTWQYRIEVAEAKGTSQSSVRSFTATPPSPGNHGPIMRTPNDPRYFQWADGTLWLGNGFNLASSDDRQHLRWNLTKLDQMGSGNENFIRFWLSGDFWGSMWNPWPSVDIGLDGNPPVTGLTIWSGYGDNVGCMRFGDTNRVVIQGWMKEKPAVQPNSTYVVRMRVRTEGVTGPANPSYPYGLTVKSTSWPVDDVTGALTTLGYTAITPHAKGDTPWHVVEGTVSTASNQWFLANGNNNLSIVLENTTAGAAWVDGIEVYAADGNGNATGPQIIRGSKMSFIQDIDPNRAWQYDQIFKRGQELGFGFMLCVAEKQDFLLQNIDVNGVPKENANGFWGAATTASNVYQRYYWRYLMARYGAYRSIFGWEVSNEADPNAWQTYSVANQLALLAKADGNPHFGGNSQWTATGSWATYYKSTAYKDIGWVDGHRYENVLDFANFYNSRATTWYGNNFLKPIIGGEMGSDHDGDVAVDTDGTWLHNFMWAHTGYTGLHTMYWYYQNTFNLDLHHIFGAWQTFMAGIPLGNGRYVNLSGTLNPNTILRVYGQKDTVAGEAHMWIQNRNHTWQAGTVPPASATFTFSMVQPNKQYTVYWVNTATGLVSSTSSVTANGSGLVTLTISNLSTDIAVKLSANPPIPNEDPGALDDKYLTGFQQTLSVSASTGVLANDTDPDGDALTVVSLLVPPVYGQAQVNADGSFTYTPQAACWGTDQFWYEVSDGNGGSSSACVYVGVAPGDISNAGLVAYLSMNEVFGTLAYDAAPSGSGVEGSGTLVNGPLWDQGKLRNAVALDGGNDYVQIPWTSDVNSGIHGQRTVGVWFKVADKSIISRRQVIYEEGDSTRGLNIYVYQNQLYIGGWNRGAGEPYWAGTWLTSSAIQNNTWHHAALVLNGSGTVTSQALIAYLDGAEIGRGSGCQLYGHDSNNCLGGYDGSTRYHSGTGSGGVLAGTVDELRIYNRVLTGQEIFTLGGSDSAPPQALGAEINAGLTQRSVILSVKVNFSESVNVQGSGLTLTNVATGLPVNLAAAVFDSASKTWNLSAVALAEGNYSARLAASAVTDLGGNPMAQDYVFTFFKLSGDGTGDRVVNLFDLLLVRQNFLKLPGDPTRDDAADVTGDGNINVFDLLRVQENYLRQLPAP